MKILQSASVSNTAFFRAAPMNAVNGKQRYGRYPMAARTTNQAGMATGQPVGDGPGRLEDDHFAQNSRPAIVEELESLVQQTEEATNDKTAAQATTGPGKQAASPVITTQTVVSGPGPRDRKTIGVGEEVILTLSTGNARTGWTTNPARAGSLVPAMGARVKFTAPDTAGIVTITAGGASVNFDVIAPKDVLMTREPGYRHNQDAPNFGIKTQPYLLPDNVNFHHVTYHEKDVVGVATNPGVYACNPSANGHCGKGGTGDCGDLAMNDVVVAGKGTRAKKMDCVYSGQCGTPPPDIPGSLVLTIPYEYKVGASGTYYPIKDVIQHHTLEADSVTLTADKAGANGSILISASRSTLPGC
jgi:hypothetical protein